MICDNLDEAGGHMLSEIRQRKINIVSCQLYMEPKKVKLLEEESRMVVTRG